MIANIISLLGAKIAESMASAIKSIIESSIASVIENYQTRALDSAKEKLSLIEQELNSKQRITNEEAIAFAKRINSVRSSL